MLNAGAGFLARFSGIFLGIALLSSGALAAPRNGEITKGSGRIASSGAHTDIYQNSDFLATRWSNFDIAAHESVQAHQPSAQARLLIRVDGGATNIAGNYTSNGITILENQNGVQFSRGAIVNVGGLLATSARISGVNGARWNLNGAGGAVVNNGVITAGASGVVLAAIRVENRGEITAKGGDISLGAGSSFTVDFAGAAVGFEITQAARGARLINEGKIKAQGGIVSLSAQEAQSVRTNVVAVGGTVEATRLERRGGVIYLSGGEEGISEVSAEVKADEKIETTGRFIAVRTGAVLSAPEILVGGDFQGKGDVQTAQRTLVEAGALLDAGAGEEARVIVWSDETTWFHGQLTAPNGFAEVSGKVHLAAVNLGGIDVAHLLLDPEIIEIATTGEDVPIGGIDSADGGLSATDNGRSRSIISAATISAFRGILTLRSSRALRVSAPITATLLTLTLSTGSISTDVNNLQLRANINVGSGTLTLESGVIRTSAVTLTARRITLQFRRAGITSTAHAQVAADIARLTFRNSGGNAVVPTYEFGQVTPPPTPATGCTVGACVINRVDADPGLGSNLRADTSITINAGVTNAADGDGRVTFAGTGPITIVSPTVTINAASIDTEGRTLTIEAAGSSLNLNADIDTGTGDLTLTSPMINIAGLMDSDTTPDVVETRSLTGQNIMLNGQVNVGALAEGVITAGAYNLAVIAAQNLVLGGDVNPQTLVNGGTFSSGILRLEATGGAIQTSGTPRLTGTHILLKQDAAFGANDFQIHTGGGTPADRATRTIESGSDQTVYPWMISNPFNVVEVESRITLISSGVLMFESSNEPLGSSDDLVGPSISVRLDAPMIRFIGEDSDATNWDIEVNGLEIDGAVTLVNSNILLASSRASEPFILTGSLDAGRGNVTIESLALSLVW